MSTVDDLARKLADQALEVMDATGDERFFVEVGQQLAAASQSLEEAFLTEVRIRLAARKAEAFIAARRGG